MKKLLIGLLLIVGMGEAQTPPPFYTQLSQQPLPPVNRIVANFSGAQGNNVLYYWVVARYFLGNAALSTPYRVAGIGNTGTVSISWSAPFTPTNSTDATQATYSLSYDVLRTTSSTFPANGVCSNCLVASGVSGLTATDTITATLASYTSNTYNPIPSPATILVDNMDFQKLLFEVLVNGKNILLEPPVPPCPVATVIAIGCVKPDGTTITIAPDGTISATGSGFGTVTSIASTAPIVATPDPITSTGTISCPTCLTTSNGVESVAATSPIVSSGGNNPIISCPTCGTGTGSVSSVATGCGLSGGPITTTGTIVDSIAVATKTGSYNILASDCGKSLTSSSGASFVLASASSYPTGNYWLLQNTGSTNVTLSTSTSVFYGSGTAGSALSIPPQLGLEIINDGTNFLVASYNSLGTSPGGISPQVQYNDSGGFGGITGATSDGTSLLVTTQAQSDNSTKAASTAQVTNAVTNNHYVTGGGSANAQTGTFSPAILAVTTGLNLCWLPIAANTSATPTFAPNGLTAITIIKTGGAALAANDIITTSVACVIYNGTNWVLQNPQGGISSGDVTKISQVTVTTPVTSVSFSSFSGYSNLMLTVADCETSLVAGNDNLQIQFNGDTGATGYASSIFTFTGASSATGNVAGQVLLQGFLGPCSGATPATGYVGDAITVQIPGYALSTLGRVKFFTSDAVANVGTSGLTLQGWSSRDIWSSDSGTAITSIALLPVMGTTLTAGTYTLYGFK